MKRWPIVASLLFVSGLVHSQTSVVTAIRIVSADGASLSRGKATKLPTDPNGTALSVARCSIQGPGVPTAAVCLIADGALTNMYGSPDAVVETSVTNQSTYSCHLMVQDAVTKWTAPMMPCAQSSGAAWGPDMYIPPASPMALVVAGPKGPQGADRALSASEGSTKSSGQENPASAGNIVGLTGDGTGKVSVQKQLNAGIVAASGSVTMPNLSMINAQMLGIKADGSLIGGTDNTAAIQAYLNTQASSAYNSGVSCLYFPPGVYRFNKGLASNSQLCLKGVPLGSGGSSVLLFGGAGTAITAYNMYGHIDDITLMSAQGPTVATIGIDGSPNQFTSHNLLIGGGIQTAFNIGMRLNGGGAGVAFYDFASAWNPTGVQFSYGLSNPVLGTTFGESATTFINPDIWAAANAAFQLNGTNGVKIEGGWIEGVQNAFLADNTSQSIYPVNLTVDQVQASLQASAGSTYATYVATAYSASGGTLTLASANNIAPGNTVTFSNGTGALAALDGLSFPVLTTGLSASGSVSANTQFEITTGLVVGSGSASATVSVAYANPQFLNFRAENSSNVFNVYGVNLTNNIVGVVSQPYCNTLTRNGGLTIGKAWKLNLVNNTWSGCTTATTYGDDSAVFVESKADTTAATAPFGGSLTGVWMRSTVAGDRNTGWYLYPNVIIPNLSAVGNVVNNASGLLGTQPFVSGTHGSFGASPAQTGIVRVPNNQAINARNASNSADVTLMYLDGDNYVEIAPYSLAEFLYGLSVNHLASIDSKGRGAFNTLAQYAAKSFAGSCKMSGNTSCTFALTTSTGYYHTPLGFASPQGPYTGGQASCVAASGAAPTVTITAPTPNSLTWNCMLIGNPN